jgi:Domain of unknown function (DUF1707)
MAEPGDETAGIADRGQFRASQADREHAIEELKTAFVQDRLTKDELDGRVSQVLTARTYTELAAVTADIPAGLIADQPPRKPARRQARPPMSNPAKAGVCVAIAIAVAAVLTFAAGGFALSLIVRFYFMALLIAGAQILASRHEKRSRGQLPPRPGRGGPAPEDRRPGQVGHDPALPGARPDQTRADLRTHGSRLTGPHCSARGARETARYTAGTRRGVTGHLRPI